MTGGEISIATLGGATASLGQVGISGSFLDASGDPPGSIVIRGGQLTIDGAFLSANTSGDLVASSVVGIDLGATEKLVITNSSAVGTETSAGGRGGDIRLAAPAVEISGASSVRAATSGAGRGGDIDVRADTLRVTDPGPTAPRSAPSLCSGAARAATYGSPWAGPRTGSAGPSRSPTAAS